MSTRTTRGSAGKASQLSAPPATPSSTKVKTHTKAKPVVKKQTSETKTIKKADAGLAIPQAITKSEKDEGSKVNSENNGTPANVSKKRKRIVIPKTDSEEDREGYGDLPHNMGRIKRGKKASVNDETEPEADPSAEKGSANKTPVKKETVEAQNDSKHPGAAKNTNIPPSTKTTPKKKMAKADSMAPASEKIKTPSRKETYGVSEGVSPFPNYPRPTPEECYKVAEILRKAHPDCHPRPKTIPEPSQIVAGCGEVPSILDAMIRTLLSAATNGRNSSNAYQGMVKRYGNRETGVGKGSVDYNAIRLAPQADLEKAIASGGLAKNKSKNIKAILDMVYDENQQRRKDLLAPNATGSNEARPDGAMKESDEQKDAEIALAEENALSLDHLYYLPTYAAISRFTKYPGIGVKTAACVSLFCMQRDCFAVDTHVFRLCQWLGWVPDQSAPGYVRAKGEPRVDRDPTFSHLEVRIPDELKYDLHQLFIRHGKKCPRCIARNSENHPDWAKGCPIEELVVRTGRMKGGSPTKKAGKVGGSSAKKSKKAADDDEDELDDDEDVDMSDIVDDEDDEEIEEAMPDLDDEEEYQSPLKSKGKTPASSVRKTTRNTKPDPATPSKGASAKKSRAAGKSRV